jgi:uncharacterized phiE125 gp8 family phage protein
MTLYRTVEPSAEPVTLAEAKQHMRIAHDSEDTLISGLIRAARDEVEKSAGVALLDQDWRLALDDWPKNDTAALMRHPVKQVLSVTLYGADGEASVMNPADYQLDALSRPARLHFERRPQSLRVMNGIEIDFRAGYGEAGTEVPDLLKRAILMLVAYWYEFRGAVGVADHPAAYPAGYERTIAAYRARRL